MIDAVALGNKLFKYRSQFKESPLDLSLATGIPEPELIEMEAGRRLPSGDELLIIADHFICDYKFFLSNERLAPFEQTETLFRRFGEVLGKADRWAIQELLFLCETEAYLQRELKKEERIPPTIRISGKHFKTHGRQAAKQVREYLGYPDAGVPTDPFRDFRSLGIHIFRRPLENATISGVFVNHPTAGRCVFVNYEEDQFRQRFTVAHEVAHSLLDTELDASLSVYGANEDEREWRANSFASGFLLPDLLVDQLAMMSFDDASVQRICLQFMVNTLTLAIALKESKKIDEHVFQRIRAVRLPHLQKTDSELDFGLSVFSAERLKSVLSRGLSSSYVRLCFEAHKAGVISLSRLAEVLLSDVPQTVDLMATFREVPEYAD